MTAPDKNEPELSRVTVRFVQDGNTCGTTSDVETLDIELEFQLCEDDGPFFVVRTAGWSFDEPPDVERLVRRVMQICNKPKEKRRERC
jgi:hypothetical protein